MSKQPRSPTRVPEAQRLSPCLVRRKSNSPSRLSTTRRVSLPMSPRTDVITIPLRSCCDNCVHITEESLKEGVEWHEKFSRAARRKRSKSLDSTFGDAVTPSLTFSAKLALNVDEVDKRRHSREFKEEESPSSEHSEDGPQSSKETPRVSPIEEEDDDQLFPLPSPRRTPTSSPVPSPSTSTSCLAASSSHDSLSISARGSASSCEDSESRVRKGRYDNGLLTPDSSPSIPAHVPAALQQQQQQHRERLFQKPIPMPPMSTPPSPSSPWPRTSSSSPERKRRRSSFSLPTPTQFLKAGAEAIKGVGAIGSAAPSVRV
jgi:hypothetical protein